MTNSKINLDEKTELIKAVDEYGDYDSASKREILKAAIPILKELNHCKEYEDWCTKNYGPEDYTGRFIYWLNSLIYEKDK